MKSIYREAVMAHILIALAVTMAQAITIYAMGITQETLALIIFIAIAQWPLMIYVVGKLWPTIEGGWSMSRFWAGLFGVSRIGYERPGLSQMPWLVLAAGGMIILPLIGISEYLLGNMNYPNILRHMIIGLILYPAAGLIAYLAGYIFGGKHQRRKTMPSIA